MKSVRKFDDLEVWQRSHELGMKVFKLTLTFPSDEIYSLTRQIRNSSRSVSGNIAEGWEKRRYEGSFVAKLVDSCGEVAETQNWLKYAVSCGYMSVELETLMNDDYNRLLRTLHAMINHSDQWCKPTRLALSQKTRNEIHPTSHIQHPT
jgi:four helix bundle protein